jgi:polyhydroxybutyrate depolymerase
MYTPDRVRPRRRLVRAALGMALVALTALTACGGGGGGGAAPPPAAPSGLSYPGPQTYTVGAAIATLTPTVTGGVTSWSVAPALPGGLALNTANGQLSGTPTTPAATATYTVTAQNAGGSTTFGLSITVNPATTAALQPGGGTTIATGQSINLFFAQQVGGAPFPNYVDAAAVTWSSSAPARAAVNANGIVTGVSEGNATITAQYQAFTLTLAVQVSGSFTARTLTVAGQGTRRYTLYTPAATTGPRPLLLSMHGGGGTAQLQAAMTRLVERAQADGFRIAFLEGTGFIQTFNGGACCGSAQTQNVDDVAYVRAVLDDLLARDPIDAARVYASGFSNGGIMSHRLACAMADRIAGIAAVGGASGQFDLAGTQYYACNPARPIPVLQIHGVNDRNYPYAGGPGDGLSNTDYYGVETTVRDWRVRNNVTDQAVTENVTATTRCLRYATPADPARASAPVTLCRVDPPDVYDATRGIVYGGGHSWPGGVRSPGASSDVPVADFDASAYLWRFLDP